MINQVFEVSKKAGKRTRYEVLAILMEEVGELATEINIAEGYKKRPEGKDGIIGECADVLNAVIDIMYLTDPTMTDEKFKAIMQKKLDKWNSYFSKVAEPVKVCKPSTWDSEAYKKARMMEGQGG